jgi:hypothetical protein
MDYLGAVVFLAHLLLLALYIGFVLLCFPLMVEQDNGLLPQYRATIKTCMSGWLQPGKRWVTLHYPGGANSLSPSLSRGGSAQGTCQESLEGEILE